ncbi:MAG: hypothetical protein FD123_1292 [Bacteroidetes bacterium]|nr:MAG: hypothetical protein FD123_1292 [Bacteroidota bacterium]
MKKLYTILLPVAVVFAFSACTFDKVEVPEEQNHPHVVACGDTTHLPTTKIIRVSDYTFSPDTVTISNGDTVRFVWISGVHTTTSTSVPNGATTWDKPMDATNCIYEHKFTVNGTYNFQCTPHSVVMFGAIIVQ